MFRNYLKISLRSLARKKGHALIRIAGLAVGMASCLVIFQYVAFEYSFDKFHEHERELYRVIQSTPLEDEGFGAGGAFTGYALGRVLEQSVPEIRNAVRLHPEYNGAIVSTPAQPERVFEEERVLYVDPAFLEMFTFPLTEGDPGSALDSGTALVSESMAVKYFGSSSPIGQVLDVTGATDIDYRVVGVFRDVPSNSHLQFDMLLPMYDLLRNESYSNEPEGGWSWNNFLTYVRLQPGVDPSQAAEKMTDAFMKHRGDVLVQHGRKARVWIQPLRDVHLNAEIVGPAGVIGSYRTVYFFTVIGLVTLLIALVNYVNLATARGLDRAREVGVRKVVGAKKRQLVGQFLFESALTNIVAAVLAIIIAVLLSPVVNDLAETSLTGALWTNPWFWAASITTLAVCILLSGLYPAFVLSSFRPISVLKGKSTTGTTRVWLRKALVVTQFAASVVLIAGTAVVYNQLSYMRNMDLGLDLEQVVTVEGPRVFADGTNRSTAMATFLQEVRRLPAVRQAAVSSSLPGHGFNWNGADVRRAEDDPSKTIRGAATYVDTSFADLYGMELVAGQGFEDLASIPTGEDDPWYVLANETAVKSLEFETPAEALHHPLYFGGTEARIIGVYRDFNWTSAHEARQNIFFGYTHTGDQVSLRVSSADLPETISAVASIYDRLFPGNVFSYAFLDEAFDQQYRNERRFATLFTLFAALAIAIACLGLYGLASFAAQQRTKEIGVRKVLGATVPSIFGLLSKEFLALVGAALVVGAPVAYVIMRRWLEGFAYRVDVGPGIFALTAAVILVTAFLTVSYHSVRAALADPVKSLRYE